MADPGTFARIYSAVRRIPAGRVATYGQIALVALGRPGGARTVGWALRVAPRDVPWQRVVAATGRIVTAGREGSAAQQRVLLEDEGIIFDLCGQVDLGRFGWDGK